MRKTKRKDSGELVLPENPNGVFKKQTIGNRNYCVYTACDDGALTVIVFDYESVEGWIGTLTSDRIAQMASSLQVSAEEFNEETKIALQGQEADAARYHLELTDGVFAWKKMLEEGIQFDFGSVEVHEVQKDKLVPFLFSKLLADHKKVQETLHGLEQCEKQLEKERQMLLLRCDYYVNAKERTEAELYSRFAAVLNAKKARIAELMSSASATEPSPLNNKNDKGQSKKHDRARRSPSSEPDKQDTSSAYDAETDVDTDEEREMENERRKKRKTHKS